MKLKIFWLSVVLLLFCRHSDGQETVSKIDKADLMRHIHTLSSIAFEGRAIDNDGQLKTQDFIVERFKELHLAPFLLDGYLEKFSLNQTESGHFSLEKPQTGDIGKVIETANVIGMIKGKSNQSIVISAHYDHMGWCGQGNDTLYRYYPGADDNASGVAALFELAEEFGQYERLNYSLIFLATSAEEGGLLGSNYHVNKPDFDPEMIICNINLDMISRCDNKKTDCNYLYCIYQEIPEALESLIKAADNRYPNCSFDYSHHDTGIFFRTDTYNFSKKGIPAILFFAGFHDDYHKPTDTIDKIDFDVFENRVKLIALVIQLLQQR